MGRKGARGQHRANPHMNQNVSTNVTHSSVETIPYREDQADVIIKSLNLSLFKTKRCPNKEDHSHKQCPYFHTPLDRKRMGGYFSLDMCEHIVKSSFCPIGDRCDRSHNHVEQLYREDKYKKKFCSKYPDKINECEYGEYCSFAHNENEVKTELIHNFVFDTDFYMFHYKTMWCPFNLTNHDKALCVYAHNWQDFRRRPDCHEYENEACPNWKSEEFIGDYSYGCKNRFDCNKCHGWKEFEFHPLQYKTRPCKNLDRCTKEGDCPMYHCDTDKRVVDPRVIQKLMRYYPKNRNIKNTFKYNRGSEYRRSLSKSVSRDNDRGDGSHINTTRSQKGGSRGGDNLLKRSIKNHQMKVMQDSAMSMRSKQKQQEHSIRSLVASGRDKLSSYDGELNDPLEHHLHRVPSSPQKNPPLNHGEGLYFSNNGPHIEAQVEEQYAYRAPQHKRPRGGLDPYMHYNTQGQITPRMPAPGRLFPHNPSAGGGYNDVAKVVSHKPGLMGEAGGTPISEKRSRSVHQDKPTLEEVHHGASIFKRNNEMLGSHNQWSPDDDRDVQGGYYESSDTHKLPSNHLSRFNERHNQTAGLQGQDQSSNWHQAGPPRKPEGLLPRQSAEESNDKKLNDFVNNLIGEEE